MIEYLNYHTVAAALNAIVLGGALVLTFIVAPSVFRGLDRRDAGVLMGAMFKLALPVFAAASLGAALLVFYRLDAFLLAANGIGYLIAWWVLSPAIEKLRDARDRGDNGATGRFRAVHALGQILNLVQMAVATLVFFRLAV